MVDPLLGQISMFAGNFAPRGWAFCHGQLLSISQNTALFSIIGTTYGGDGRTTFALPDLRGRAPICLGQGPGLSNRQLGSRFGSETHNLSVFEMPPHSHTATGSGASLLSTDAAVRETPITGDVPAEAAFKEGFNNTKVKSFGPASNTVVGQSSGAPNIGLTGNGQPHNNMQPSLTISYVIALVGVFPSRN